MVFIIYTISDQDTSALQNIIHCLQRQYDPQPRGRWTLDHRLLRSTPVSAEDKSHLNLQDIISLGHHAGRTFITISDYGKNDQQEGQVLAVSAQQSEAYFVLLTTKLSAMWTSRTHLRVTDGATYEVGEFTIRLGEMRQMAPSTTSKGSIVAIEVPPMSENPEPEGEQQILTEEALETSRHLIREFWKTFGVENAKETASRFGKQGIDVEVRLWCEAVRSR